MAIVHAATGHDPEEDIGLKTKRLTDWSTVLTKILTFPIYLLFQCGATPGNAESLFLVLCLGITTDGAQVTICGSEVKLNSLACKASALFPGLLL